MVVAEPEGSLSPDQEWEVLSVCFDEVAETLKAAAGFDGEMTEANRFFDGLKEAFGAALAFASANGLRAPDPMYFCCCEEPDAERAICVIHGAMALRQKVKR